METEAVQTEAPAEKPAAEKAGEFLSQKSFRPTPYRSTDWEIVGEVLQERNFLPLELSIIRTQAAKIDPMFEDFAQGKGSDDASRWHTASGKGGVPQEKEPPPPVINEAEISERARKAFEEGRAAGAAEGEVKARAEAEKELTEIRQRAQELQKTVNTELQRVVAELEQRAFELALNVAKKILETTANAKPDYIYDVIRRALRASESGTILKIRVAPADWELIKLEGLPEDLSTGEVSGKFVMDDTIASGCVVETDFGDIDMRLSEMWEQVRESLFEVAR